MQATGLAANMLGLLLLIRPYPGSCDSIGLLNIDVEVTGNDIKVSWTMNTQSENIYGFKAIIYNDKQEALYTSSVIQSLEREMTISYELKGTSSICLQALHNSTQVLQEACKEVKVNDLKMVTGILAGAIFLIPCIMALAYIIYKDRKISGLGLENYTELESHKEHSTDSESSNDTKKTVKDPQSAAGNVNNAYAADSIKGKEVKEKASNALDSAERKDNKVPSLFKHSVRKDVVIADETRKGGQAENVQSTDSHSSRASKKHTSPKTNHAKDISQQETEIYVVRL